MPDDEPTATAPADGEAPDPVAPLAEEITRGTLSIDEARALQDALHKLADEHPGTMTVLPAQQPANVPEWRNWYYTGHERIYTNIPVTVTTGDIVHWHSDPGLGDGSWTATTAAANKHPDNYRKDPAPSAADTPEEG